ncbi:MAG: DNA recombination protein RmuC [Gammaproteobacteria bacterium]|nr:DNA recombination protein RmuC [Gammaproteobacteria bacterium]MBU1446965.1 DNA recombination protein RmuC [Gammaproteobacteria bacterium]MDD2928935.1 DNA recombination protein RmuC [Sideroxydans sp.]MDD5472044.1 DNA recombination protein RmuC [Sideroxydans sp.]
MLEILSVIAVVILLALLALQFKQPARIARILEQQHRAMLTDLHDGLNKQGDRLIAAQAAESERLRTAVGEELRATRDAIAALRTEMLAQMLERMAEQGRADQKLIQDSFNNASQHLRNSIDTLSKTVDGRLEQIGGKVNERLDEGFKKTNETFVSVMARLATIDEAQKKIDGLTTNVVSLQELLGDKRSRGAFGEVQLEGLVRNIMPSNAYEMQYTLPNGTRADCVLKLPEPTGMVAVDSKFPLENYRRMLDGETGAEKQFKADLKKHVDDIASKYIIPDVTSDGAVMFIPAEAVFAEIHAHHPDLIEYAMQRRVWVVSPTTLMAVLNTARAVMKDVETRKQVHIIKDELGKLGKEFGRFDERMKKLADHIRQAHEDAQSVRTTSEKISRRFISIEQVELDHPVALPDIDRE